MSQTLAVARYTLLELVRRRVVLAIVAIGMVLMAGIALAPHVISGNSTDTDRIIVALTALQGVVPSAVTICAFAVGMTVINHDLDSGAVVSIFAKPVPRAAYTAGKLLAAVSLLLVVMAIFTGGSLIDVAVNGGSVYWVVWWTCAALAANIVLLMLLVMALTVYLNNVVAAAIVLAFNFGAAQVLTLHAMVQSHVITDRLLQGIVNFAYWAVPHELTSNLQRQILLLQIANGNMRFRGNENPIDRVPGASDVVDVAFWAAYVVAICVVLFWSVRRKQV